MQHTITKTVKRREKKTSKKVNVVEKLLFALRKVRQLYFTGEVDRFITFWCRACSGSCIPRAIQIGWFLRCYSKKWNGTLRGRF